MASAPKLPGQQEIYRTLKKIDGDVRDFARVLDRAKGAIDKGAIDGTDTEIYADGLKAGVENLKSHRAQIRTWASQLGPKNNYKDKLAASRANIEKELHRFQGMEKGFKSKVSPRMSPSSPSQGPVVNDCKIQTSLVLPPAADGDSSDNQHVEEKPSGEVKVLSEQLLCADSEERQMLEEFICKICQIHVVGCMPKMTNCSHLFCGDCLAKWFAVHPGNQSWAQRVVSRSVPCPVCKEALHEEDLHTVCSEGEGGAALLWQMLCGTRIVCSNNPQCKAGGNCNWIGDYGSFKEHIAVCTNAAIFDYSNVAPSPVVGNFSKEDAAANDGTKENVDFQNEEEEVLFFSDADDSDDGTAEEDGEDADEAEDVAGRKVFEEVVAAVDEQEAVAHDVAQSGEAVDKRLLDHGKAGLDQSLVGDPTVQKVDAVETDGNPLVHSNTINEQPGRAKDGVDGMIEPSQGQLCTGAAESGEAGNEEAAGQPSLSSLIGALLNLKVKEHMAGGTSAAETSSLASIFAPKTGEVASSIFVPEEGESVSSILAPETNEHASIFAPASASDTVGKQNALAAATGNLPSAAQEQGKETTKKKSPKKSAAQVAPNQGAMTQAESARLKAAQMQMAQWQHACAMQARWQAAHAAQAMHWQAAQAARMGTPEQMAYAANAAQWRAAQAAWAAQAANQW